ncbi:MAG: 2-hydroxyacid dehydrogenase [Candidatus Omnitrophica bacterium]|nr:2-hydroxyacid dehydrogenase [Candidatus Omnitrophota bacterium]
MTIKIAFFDAKPYDKGSFEAVNKEFGFEIKYFKSHLTEDNVSLTQGFDAICIFVNDMVTKTIIETLSRNNVKLIALRCAGYNNVDLKAIWQKIHVVRVPAYSPYAVAEHTLALILGLNRKTHKAYHRTRDGNFAINGLLGFDLNGKTAGIIGTGKIGKITAGILRGFGMRVLLYDKFPDEKYAAASGCTYVPLEELYKESDIISLHCPLTPETHYIINEVSINTMKKGVMIINTGRGKLIDTKALIQGLKSGQIGSAGLDVYEEESEYFFEDFSNSVIEDDVLARLLTFPNVLVTAHQAFFTEEALRNIAETTLTNIKLFFEKNELPNEICYKCDAAACPRKKTGKCF